MSLRLRLLVAVGLIAIVALVVADFATYSALRTTLYNQVDQELAHQPPRLRAERGHRRRPSARRRSTTSVAPVRWGTPAAVPTEGGRASPTSSASATSAS